MPGLRELRSTLFAISALGTSEGELAALLSICSAGPVPGRPHPAGDLEDSGAWRLASNGQVHDAWADVEFSAICSCISAQPGSLISVSNADRCVA
jgi:hypothetical protein